MPPNIQVLELNEIRIPYFYLSAHTSAHTKGVHVPVLTFNSSCLWMIAALEEVWRLDRRNSCSPLN